jgi:hypothetical protein
MAPLWFSIAAVVAVSATTAVRGTAQELMTAQLPPVAALVLVAVGFGADPTNEQHDHGEDDRIRRRD